MEEELNKAIAEFSKGNESLAKILALFSAQMIVIFGRHFTTEFNDRLMKASSGLLNYYDLNK